MSIRSLFRNLLKRPQVEQDLDDEVRTYLDMVVDEKIAQGMSPAEARRAARIEIGGIETLKEEVRAVRIGRSIEAFWQDIRFGSRTLFKTPGVTFVVILSLALGIGANTAIFSIVNALLLRSLPVDRPEELVLFSEGRSRGFLSGQSGRWSIFSYPLYRDLRREQKSFLDVAAFRTQIDRVNFRQQETSQLAWGRLVSGNYFSVLGVRPMLGRVFEKEDESVGAMPVAVLSFTFWQRSFQGSPSVIGQMTNLNGVPVAIVGVAPEEFFGETVESELADVWLPLTLQPRVMPRKSALEETDTSWLHLIGRLRPGVGMQQAEAEINVPFQQHLRQLAGAVLTNEQEQGLRRNHIGLISGAQGVSSLRNRYSRPLQILLAVVGFVLLIACANVANLLLARGAAREKEISMRLALGASRKRLLRQLLTESLFLAFLGGVAGVLLSSWMVKVLVAGISTGDRIVPLDVSPDLKVLVFTLAVCLLTGILFGLVPALRATGVDVWPALKGMQVSHRHSRWGFTQTLIAIQVALSLPLVVGAALFVQTLQYLRSQNLGFLPEKVLEVGIDPSLSGYRPDQLEALYQNLLDCVNRINGVRAASLSHYSAMSGNNWMSPMDVEGYTPPPKEAAFSQWVWAGPRYAETTGMTLLLGRDLSGQDTQNSRRVALVNESFARRYFNGQNPVGRRFSIPFLGDPASIEIVGIVKDAKFNDPRQEFRPIAFIPLTQAPVEPARYAKFLEVRTQGDPIAIAAAVRESIRQIDRNLPVTTIQTLERQVSDAMAQEQLIAAISSFFAVLALALACIGVYGVLAYAVTQRTREIGVRIAVGARRSSILKMVLREALLLTIVGIAVGIAVSFAVSGAISSQLYGLQSTDGSTLIGASLLLLAAAALAGFVPAHRASRVDPMTTLRAD